MKKLSLITAIAMFVGLPIQADTVVFAGGCFWCVESDFESVMGVSEVTSGYTGGRTESPTYYDVASGRTGHYEAVKVEYDPSVVSREQLYHLFFRSIDPLDAGGQFCDRGSPYRTAIFVTDGADRAAAETAKSQAARALGASVATRILPREEFYEAEDYHQDYSSSKSWTWRGLLPSTRQQAYAYYRNACGRDARVKALWGDEAVFANKR